MTPIVVRVERVVVVPVDVVWQIVEPAETLPAWLPICDRCEVTGGSGRARRQRMYSRWGRKAAEIDQEVTEYEPSARLSWRHVAERLNGAPAPRLSLEVVMSIELRSVGAGTKVALSARHVPANAWAALMVRWVAVPRERAAFGRALDILAASGG
jgi:uncharacterized protein YndB with AHSA1/START domain